MDCVYDALYEGMTKQQSAEYEINRLQDVIAGLNQTFHVLKYGAPEEAQALLAAIRLDAQDEQTEDESLRHDVSDAMSLFT